MKDNWKLFKKRHKKNWKVDPRTGCWEWKLHRNKGGYGTIRWNGKAGKKAHRVSYEAKHGPIPEGMHVCHHCDNPACIRPAHLFLGTHKDNMRDRGIKGRGKVQYGEHNSLAKLTDDDVIVIIHRIKVEGNMAQIARDYGIHRSAIYKINNNETWIHIPRD